jgi:hypothetical protein
VLGRFTLDFDEVGRNPLRLAIDVDYDLVVFDS